MNNIKIGTTMAAAAMLAAMGVAQGISVTVNGKLVRFENGGPRSINGRVLVPLRGVFEEMGAFVEWDASNRDVIANRGGKDLRLHIGAKEATVDGRQVMLDVPAMILNGTTLVPIRYLSESLGSQVTWRESDQMVLIDGRSGGLNGESERPEYLRDRQGRRRDENGRYQDPNGAWHRAKGRWQDSNGKWHEVHSSTGQGSRAQTMIGSTVIPVSLDTPLSSQDSRPGQKFTATVRSSGDDYYGMLPMGTKVEGRVVTAHEQSGRNPGILELDFQNVILPNGHTYPISGDLVSLTAKGVVRDADGHITATGDARDNRGIYAGYGAGAGLIVGLLTKKPLEGTLLGGILGYAAGQIQKDRKDKPANVRLAPGSEFGVRLSEPLTLNEKGGRSR